MNSKSSEKEISQQLKEMVGIIGFEMIHTITTDVATFLKRRTDQNADKVEAALDGYMLALSRIIEKNVAWKCVEEAFSSQNVDVPTKYYDLFNLSEDEREE